ncbi:MAG: hypothetical protein JOZ19_00650 [Rubrobacter sp.]|nr:hypothetical protein [Rubrobacter sp.]
MKRILAIFAVVALVVALMVFVASAMADMDISSSGGDMSMGSLDGGYIDIGD